MKPDNCRHFNGFQNATCEAGVNYLQAAGGKRDAIALRMPCCGSLHKECAMRGLEPVACDKFESPTAEELAETEANRKRLVDRIKKMLPWEAEKKKEFPCGTKGYQTDKCPICGGVIHFTIASYNRHMRARCETEGCLNFME